MTFAISATLSRSSSMIWDILAAERGSGSRNFAGSRVMQKIHADLQDAHSKVGALHDKARSALQIVSSCNSGGAKFEQCSELFFGFSSRRSTVYIPSVGMCLFLQSVTTRYSLFEVPSGGGRVGRCMGSTSRGSRFLPEAHDVRGPQSGKREKHVQQSCGTSGCTQRSPLLHVFPIWWRVA